MSVISIYRKSLRFFTIAVVLVGVAACSRVEPVYNVHNRPIPSVAQKLTLPEIEKTIILAGAQRNWRFEPVKPGQLKARYFNGKHEAVVDITYSQTSFSIDLNSTSNLKETETGIHQTYNRWIRTLEQDIDERLYKAGLAKS